MRACMHYIYSRGSLGCVIDCSCALSVAPNSSLILPRPAFGEVWAAFAGEVFAAFAAGEVLAAFAGEVFAAFAGEVLAASAGALFAVGLVCAFPAVLEDPH